MALAPAGQRTWAVGEVVTQTLMQTFVQDQVVHVMTSTARDALTVDASSAGAVVFNTTDATLDIYSGSAWVTYATSGGVSEDVVDGGNSGSWVRHLVSAEGGTSTG
jgi:hypothetical protein